MERTQGMALVLFNIGWMKHYQGQTPSDRIINGGSYVKDNETGGEVENFRPHGDWHYAYVQPLGNKINLEHLGAARGTPYADDVTIVFTATRPEGGCVVVGWYRDARVWRDEQRLGNRAYFAKAKKVDSTLLEVDDRVLRVPRSRQRVDAFVMGRSNVRYVRNKDETDEFIRKLREYVKDPATTEVSSSDKRQRGVPGQNDPAHRAAVEEAAIKHVIDHYSAYECVSVEAENKGWDLEFTRGAVKLLVEVKGCSGEIGHVELTPNEYEAMRHSVHGNQYRLAVVTRALDRPRLSIVSFNASDETWRDQYDREVRLQERTAARVLCAPVVPD